MFLRLSSKDFIKKFRCIVTFTSQFVNINVCSLIQSRREIRELAGSIQPVGLDFFFRVIFQFIVILPRLFFIKAVSQRLVFFNDDCCIQCTVHIIRLQKHKKWFECVRKAATVGPNSSRPAHIRIWKACETLKFI